MTDTAVTPSNATDLTDRNHIDDCRPVLTTGAADVPVWHPSVADFEAAWPMIPTALARIPRFNGLNRGPKVSVAAHLLNCGALAKDRGVQHVLPALLHDAHEAVVHDLARPLKKELGTIYSMIETGWQDAAAAWAGIDGAEMRSQAIHAIDNLALACECQVAHPDALERWDGLPQPTDEQIDRAREFIALSEIEAAAAWQGSVNIARLAFGRAA